MASDDVTHAVVVLVDDAEDATSIAAVIADVARPNLALVPPRRGAAFFTDGDGASEVDTWWRENVPPAALLVYVMDFSPAALSWLAGLDGHFIIRGGPPGLASAASASVETTDAASALELAAQVLRRLAAAGACDVDDAEGLLAFARATRAGDPAEPPAPAANPFDLLAAMPPAPPSAPAESSPPEPAPPHAVGNGLPHLAVVRHTDNRRSVVDMLRLPSLRGGRSSRPDVVADDAELAARLANRRSTIVAVGSRKGGVGKTSHAAGMAIVAGSVLDAIGHKAAIVDANVANPDAWGVLNLPVGAATVRDTIAALSAHLDPPRPVFATTPALACYPESRDSSEYSRHDIRLLAEHLRRSYTVAVIDLSNRLPDPTGGPEAAAAAYWLELADAVVLPTAWSKQDFNGVLDYLELPDLPPAVVAYIAPRARRHREHPLTQRYVDAIALRARSIVELPDEADNVRYAGMAGVSVDSVSRRLRAGYRALTQAVVLAAGAAR